MQPSLPLRQRPWDYAYIFFFLLNFFFITYIVDIEQIIIPDPSNFKYPFWPPPFFVDMVHNYQRTYDPVVWNRMPWYQATIWIDSLLFGPFYAIAIYAFIKGKPWIRIPCIIWATMLFTIVMIIMMEELAGSTPTTYPVMVTLLNMPWATVPVLMIWKMWRDGNPFAKRS